VINPGTRPSRLLLARHATGELSGDTSPSSPDTAGAAAWRAGLDANRPRVEPFDMEVLRARAARLEDTTEPRTRPAPAWRRWLLLAPVLAVAMAVFLAVRPGPTNRLKGNADLGFYVLRGDEVYPGDPDATFRAGDRLQFTYRAAHDRLVLLSIDGDGRLTRYFPEAGEVGVPIIPGDRHVLDRSILLDDAPGPEVFLGFFGDAWSVQQATALAERTYADGGADALVALSAEDPSIAALLLEKE